MPTGVDLFPVDQDGTERERTAHGGAVQGGRCGMDQEQRAVESGGPVVAERQAVHCLRPGVCAQPRKAEQGGGL